MRWLSEWVCGDNKVDTQVHNTFNDPFRVLLEERGNLWQLNDLTDFGGLIGYE